MQDKQRGLCAREGGFNYASVVDNSVKGESRERVCYHVSFSCEVEGSDRDAVVQRKRQ